MATTIEQLDELSAYVQGVMGRADHHAENVEDVALPLVGAILWRKDPDTEVTVRTHNGETKNVLWATINHSRYCFAYNHKNHTIEMRVGSLQGEVLRRFNNEDSARSVREFFKGL